MKAPLRSYLGFKEHTLWVALVSRPCLGLLAEPHRQGRGLGTRLQAICFTAVQEAQNSATQSVCFSQEWKGINYLLPWLPQGNLP